MFGTSGIRGRVGESITASVALDVGRAVGTDADRVLVGRDARDSGRTLRDALVAGLQETGTDVLDAGLAATPTVARGIAAREADAGVVVTASHNPPEDNGLKLWTPSGQAFSTAQQEEVAERIREADFDLAEWDEQGTHRAWDDATAGHREALVEAGRRDAAAGDADLSSLSVVVDAGNGMGGVTAEALYDLGVDVETLNDRPDGRFPARPSEPTAETCATLAATVPAVGADLGIAHDGDADRMMAVADDGEFVPGDLLLALFGREEAGSGDRVAAPVNTSLAVDDALAAVGAEVVHTRVGDVYVAERARDPAVAFGGEPSGAWIFPEETLCPDGTLAAVKLAALAAAEPISDRLARIDRYPIRRATVETDAKDAVMDAVDGLVRERYDEVTALDGVRVETADGWFLIRPSGTQPLIRLTAEAREPETATELLSTVRSLVEAAVETET
ncbi:phosphoglucosamine mutase [Halorubrum lipolyticum]|uniref:Phosphoglucosamine mutase n=1 Tax=Halorubrum lipolyticum DSM 21995 TaxID=1227482 RepID=M0NP38_9EURY|nr:phosphoglucosamine mutase [Halorubrum lipolyticum]EMA58934.1 phosphoglucosamine mutase [Halorubrum lipolyticum DSM 21995]